ncbi:hypothetical protein EAH88_11740 [Rhodanobacter glycinis]|uniref:Uncharacterized protein n=1 Tax=Rhodanobacter glycinis TaxID=582702 RepID=A0A502C8H7_9GAMM|nr:hypothetical protein [Rhodanobacter glycinis]TPG08299.1 hypothetical protein EAH88_11740 [Rhodanobacter glycinis]
MKRILFFAFGLASLGVAVAQVPTRVDQQRALVMQRLLLQSRSCTSNSHKCQAVCEANHQLQEAADDLKRCAESQDFSDSCDRQFNDARDAHDALETSVSDADGDCD